MPVTINVHQRESIRGGAYQEVVSDDYQYQYVKIHVDNEEVNIFTTSLDDLEELVRKLHQDVMDIKASNINKE